MALVCLLSGIFIDIDHQLDFYLLFKRFTWSISELRDQLLEHNTHTFFCPLHSWEFIILLVLLSYRFDVFIGAVVGVTVHIAVDIIFNEYEAIQKYGVIAIFKRFFFLSRVRRDLKKYKEFRRNYTPKPKNL